jgi:hypothetical protein
MFTDATNLALLKTKSRPQFTTSQTIVGHTKEGERVQGRITAITDNTYRVETKGRHYAVVRSTARLPYTHAVEGLVVRIMDGSIK